MPAGFLSLCLTFRHALCRTPSLYACLAPHPACLPIPIFTWPLSSPLPHSLPSKPSPSYHRYSSHLPFLCTLACLVVDMGLDHKQLISLGVCLVMCLVVELSCLLAHAQPNPPPNVTLRFFLLLLPDVTSSWL